MSELGAGGGLGDPRPVLVIAPTLPKYSETWMRRMTQMLGPGVIFIALLGSSVGAQEVEGIRAEVILKKRARVPDRVLIELGKATIEKRILAIIEAQGRGGQPISVLCHYMTTAVQLRSLWALKCVRGLIHCHGHDVTWDRRVEALPFVPAHGFTYKSRVRGLIGKVKPIANSRATREKLLEIGFPDADISIKYLGVEVGGTKPNSFSLVDELEILYLGRLTDFKGPVETIRAFSIACSRGLRARLNVVGDGALRRRCEEEAQHSGYSAKIAFYGAVSASQAMDFMSRAHVFTAHNKRSSKTGQEEAFGVSIIEAMAHAVPVVTGRSGGVRETVVDGETGILFEPGDINAQADAFMKLQAEPQTRMQMGAAGRARAESEFSLERERQRLLEIVGLN